MPRSVGEDESHEQDQEAARVAFEPKYCVKAPIFFVPGSRINGLVDPIPLRLPGNFSRQRTLCSEPQSAIESHPALHFGISEMAAAATHLPDALVRLLPVFDHQPIEQEGNGVPHLVLVVQVQGIQQLTVNVELQMAECAFPTRTGFDPQ
jgi:hypothetical protein